MWLCAWRKNSLLEEQGAAKVPTHMLWAELLVSEQTGKDHLLLGAAAEKSKGNMLEV